MHTASLQQADMIMGWCKQATLFPFTLPNQQPSPTLLRPRPGRARGTHLGFFCAGGRAAPGSAAARPSASAAASSASTAKLTRLPACFAPRSGAGASGAAGSGAGGAAAGSWAGGAADRTGAGAGA